MAAADNAYGELHDKITAFEARVADPNRLKSRDRRHAKSALEEESERSKFKKLTAAAAARLNEALRAWRETYGDTPLNERAVLCDAAHGACRPAANHEPLVKPSTARMHLDTKQGRDRGSDASDSALPSAPPPPKLVASAVACGCGQDVGR